MTLLAMALSALLLSCRREAEIKVGELIYCDLEQITDDGKFFISNTHPDKLFEGADKRSGFFARSGMNSILLMEGRAFGLATELHHVGGDERYELTIWRKGNIDKGFINVGDATGKYFYKANEEADSVDADGWQRIRLRFYVPPNLNDATLKIYAWNPNKDSVFYDDISIRRILPETYPEYEGITGLKLYVDTVNTLKLAEKRKQAFDDFILQTEDDDWVEGMLFEGDELYRTELRLKGDWLDHLLGSKWSFRIEVKGGETWNGMRTFSVQNPASRDFLNEWLMHDFCRENDILATRYGFIPLSLNGTSLGIYAWEEHFEKYLIESNNRREGPILKVNEDALWANALLKNKFREDISLPVVMAAEIMPFKEKRTTRDANLFHQYLIAQELYYQYKFAERPVSEIFDIDKLARYLAMIDLFRTYHGVTWHNQRFYYNPVISRLEPIAFDNFSEKGPVQYYSRAIMGDHYLDMETAGDENLMLGGIFRDPELNEHYITYLEKFADERFITDYLDSREAMLLFYDSLIRLEYPGNRFSKQYILDNAARIREELPGFIAKAASAAEKLPIRYDIEEPEYGRTENNIVSEKFVKAFTQASNDTSAIFRIENYFTSDIYLLGTSKNGTSLRDMFPPDFKVGPVSGRNPGTAEVTSRPSARYLHYMVEGDMATYVVPLYAWPTPTGKESPLQRIQGLYSDNYLKYFSQAGEGRLTMEKGEYDVSEPLLIPPGYEVTIRAGATINITGGALFISYSPLYIIGSENEPVVVKSSDGTAKGFSVFQAAKRSKVSHAVFDRLNTLDLDGWLLTGAVTFYESDVDFYSTTFSNNLCEDGLNIIRSEFTIDHCEVLNTFGDALDVDFGKGVISNTAFRYLSNDAIDVSGSDIDVVNCVVTESNDKGVSGGENSVVRVKDTKISGSVIGVASKDYSRVTLEGCTIEDCRYGLVVFRKKPEFGPATITATDLLMKNITNPYLIEEGSSCQVNGEKLADDQQNVFDIFYQ